MVSSQSKMMTASFCERDKAIVSYGEAYLMLASYDTFRLHCSNIHDEKILPPTMQKIRPCRACIDLPFDPLLGGGDMVASVFAACNGLSLLLIEQWMEKNEKPSKNLTGFGARRTMASRPGQISTDFIMMDDFQLI